MSKMIRTQREGVIPKTLAALALAAVIFTISANSANSATTFVVNDKFDSSDEDLTDNVCDVAVLIAGEQCTLRAAIEQANATSGADTINFNIPDDPSISGDEVRTISPVSVLPNITEQVTINGYSQPGASPNTNGPGLGDNAVLRVELNGSNAGANASGLSITSTTSGNSKVRGLVINRFAQHGILLSGQGNVVEGNFIGTNAAGDTALGNGTAGVIINASGSATGNNTVGGTTPAARNLISGNSLSGGIWINAGDVNKVQGNLIGTKANGIEPLGNLGNGVWLRHGVGNVVGGTTAAARNVISGNGQNGVLFDVGTLGAQVGGNLVQGNYIGTDVTGTDDLGNSQAGVVLDGTNGTMDLNTIGGSTIGARNVISANAQEGVLIFGAGASSNFVAGNYIGTDKTGTADLGNGWHGVLIASGASDNNIGDASADAANTIAFNGSSFEDGVRIGGAVGGTGNSIRRNSIFSNADLGIDLGDNGVTPNDTGDPDTGANNLQNFPVLTSAKTSHRGTTIKGTLNSTARTTFTILFFSGPAMDLEGKKFLGQKSVTTDASGNTSFTFKTKKKAAGEVTATATNPNGDTSEFSAAKKVVRRR
jgi:hypothetical protein